MTTAAGSPSSGEQPAGGQPAVDAARQRFLERLADAVHGGRLRRLRLNRPLRQPDLQRVDGRLIRLKGEPAFSFVWHHATRDETRNLAPGDALAWIGSALGPDFGAAVLTTDRHEIELGFSRRGRALLRSRALTTEAPGPITAGADAAVEAEAEADAEAAAGEPAASEPAAAHNRSKSRWIDRRRPWLAALGVTDARGEVIPAMARKWRQIDRFVEIFDGAWRAARRDDSAAGGSEAGGPALGRPGRPIRIVDLGAGKGYLTFAIYDHLTRQGQHVRMTGIERRADLVEAGNRIAREAGFTGLDFRAGDILDGALRDGSPGERLDVMIALHACDTATDDALFRGLQAQAAVLISSPCCHKEIRPQLLAPHPLAPLLRHGVQRGDLAEMVTDTMRALLLEAEGYETKIFEFVALEHTARNRMILATRRDRPADAVSARADYAALKQFHGIRQQRLEGLLSAR